MQSLAFLQLYEQCKCKCNYASPCVQADMHRQVHVHAVPGKFSHYIYIYIYIYIYMHACLACNYPEALSYCGHGHDLTSVTQLSVINIADIRSAFNKTLVSRRWRAVAEKPFGGLLC